MNQINKIKKISAIFVIILFLSILSGCIKTSDDSSNNVVYGEDFQFFLLDGSVKNVSDYAGKIVIVDFTGAYCPYCVPQTFVLEEIYNEYSSDDVVIVSIFVWMVLGETIQDITNLIAAYRCSSPCNAEEQFSRVSLRDAKEYYGKEEGLELSWVFGYDDSFGTLYNNYGKNGIPYLLILDKNGDIYYSNVGYTDYDSLTSKLPK